MKEAWLHRRALRANLCKATLPLFVLSSSASEAACELVEKNAYDQERMDEMVQFSLWPAPWFAVEVDCIGTHFDQTPGAPKRMLVVGNPTKDEEWVMGTAFCASDHWPSGLQLMSCWQTNFADVWGPPAWAEALNGDIKSMDAWRAQVNSLGVGLNYPKTSDSCLALTDLISRNAKFCNAVLMASLAVIATPGLPREEGRSRAPEPKQRSRGAVAKPAEFAWSRISLDIDRTVSGGEKAQEAEARKLALHRVRAHLRFIKDKGLVPVRSHMRGNAAHGVRIGRTLVHKGGN